MNVFNKYFRCLVLCLFGLLIFSSCKKSDDSNDNISLFLESMSQSSESNLIFSDDFDGNDIDYSKWEKCPEWERQSHMENHGWWSRSCSYVQDGNLVLEVKKDSAGKLISGAVRSKNRFENSKGTYEIKFKVENGSGFWYAFWIFAKNDRQHISGNAKNGAEIDCFELLPGLNNQMMSTIHWDAYDSEHKSKATSNRNVGSSFYNDWHVYRFDWKDTYYACYLDGNLLWKMDGNEYGGGVCEENGYMKITTEFGSWGGGLDSFISNGGTKRMLVDYVRVYK